ncbi:hypothetical protein WN51_02095 [Melipona quadrifasciata]|uniref:Uncharacterized protein n=1 Tax=Melipona quadrifasciata TaxID=166423 RepID=A0A0M8ZYB3_9HYME|nr:hypothetical protein WN51_02095 [Melipona quadrifasciata]
MTEKFNKNVGYEGLMNITTTSKYLFAHRHWTMMYHLARMLRFYAISNFRERCPMEIRE